MLRARAMPALLDNDDERERCLQTLLVWIVRRIGRRRHHGVADREILLRASDEALEEMEMVVKGMGFVIRRPTAHSLLGARNRSAPLGQLSRQALARPVGGQSWRRGEQARRGGFPFRQMQSTGALADGVIELTQTLAKFTRQIKERAYERDRLVSVQAELRQHLAWQQQRMHSLQRDVERLHNETSWLAEKTIEVNQ